MSVKFLLVESDSHLAKTHSAVWAERGMEMERADSMSEAIQKVLATDYLYIGINSDNINYLPMLNTLRNATDTPLFIVTSRFTTQAEIEALCSGADLFARWHNTPEENMASVMAHISRITHLGKTWKRKPLILSCGNLLILTEYKMTFFDDREVVLTAKEYSVLVYLINHRNMTLSTRQIAESEWDEDVSDSAVWKIIEMLRKRLSASGFTGGTIINYRGMGYRFSTVQKQLCAQTR